MIEANKFNKHLIDWYQQNKRDLPWRRTTNPYYIWLSEVMLQQTQVDTVKSYYERFIDKYPDLISLANAPEEEVLKQWEGLGYYSRARNLHTAIKEVADKYQGQVPNDPEKFASLKGVGPYTRGSVMSIAYNLPIAAVDGNVFRVWSRLNALNDDITKGATRKKFEQAITEIIPKQQASDFNQALMELGALICKPKNAKCDDCPVQKHCQSYHDDTVYQFPVKTKKIKNKQLTYDVYVMMDEQHHWLMQQRPAKGLLANMWEFPMYEDEVAIHKLEEDYNVTVITQPVELMTLKHVFTHLTWHLNVYVVKIKNDSQQRLMSLEDLPHLTVSVPVQKIIKQIIK